MFVAGFIGSPAMNLFEAQVTDLDGNLAVSFGPHSIDIPDNVLDAHADLKAFVGKKIALGIRPDDMYDAAIQPQYAARITGTPILLESLGSEIVTHLDIGVTPMQSTDPDMEDIEADTEQGSAVVARFSPHSNVQKNAPIEMSIDTARLHFFDLATSNMI